MSGIHREASGDAEPQAGDSEGLGAAMSEMLLAMEVAQEGISQLDYELNAMRKARRPPMKPMKPPRSRWRQAAPGPADARAW
jgi:hypothetical protein